jgi:hypothetical protein
MTSRLSFVAGICVILTADHNQVVGTIANATGLRLVVDEENSQPVLRIVLPGSAQSDRTIEVIFPEHVTARRGGQANAEQLYLFRPGRVGERPMWRQRGQSLEYDMTLAGAVQLLARASLEDDGVRVHYEFRNRSDTAFDMVYAVTDPRLTARFHDIRLERTYVHHQDGFDLLASETPNRLSMPLTAWLPSRYLASFTWPVPAERVARAGDGITYYNKSRAVDEPWIATLSIDRTWVVASVAREVGNVWSNPELTCQHVDPQVALAPKSEATTEIKILVMRGTLADVHARALAERTSLK